MVIENMGCQVSKADDRLPLLYDTDEVAIIEKISLVLMGHHGVGKNAVGNALLKKKAFTYKDSFKHHYLKHDNTTFGRHVTVTRVPGWYADLKSEKNCQIWLLIKDSMRSVDDGPHVIILVVNTNTEPEMTTGKLKQLLGDHVSQHILIISVDSKQLVVHHSKRKQTIIDRCKYHFFGCNVKCEKQNLTFIETIEDFILSKPDIRFYDMWKKAPNLELQYLDLANLVEGLQCKIAALSYLQDSNRLDLESKTDEINELKCLLKKKEDVLKAKEVEIKRVKSNHNETALQMKDLQRKLDEIEKEKNKEIERLKEENQALKSQNQNEETSFIFPRRKDSNSNELVPLLSAETDCEDSEGYRAMQFLKKNCKELIERIVSVMPIADDLHQIIGRHKYEQILQAPNETEKKRQLYDITEKGRTKLQVEFYKCLLKYEEHLVEDLMEPP